jgi:flagellar basal body-associated protein FliL
MKSPASKNKPALQKKVSPIIAIVVAIVVIGLVGGIYTYISNRNAAKMGEPLMKSFDYMHDLKKDAIDRWDKEVASAKAAGRAPNEAFRPGPNMAPIGDRKPLRMGPRAGLATTPAPATGQ